jgi:hypothetical protein
VQAVKKPLRPPHPGFGLAYRRICPYCEGTLLPAKRSRDHMSVVIYLVLTVAIFAALGGLLKFEL